MEKLITMHWKILLSGTSADHRIGKLQTSDSKKGTPNCKNSLYSQPGIAQIQPPCSLEFHNPPSLAKKLILTQLLESQPMPQDSFKGDRIFLSKNIGRLVGPPVYPAGICRDEYHSRVSISLSLLTSSVGDRLRREKTGGFFGGVFFFWGFPLF